jgi:hypothetical protein
MFTVTGLLTGIKEGTYNGNLQITALVLPEGAERPAAVILASPDYIKHLESRVRQDVTLAFNLISGRGEKGQWFMLVDGRPQTVAVTKAA